MALDPVSTNSIRGFGTLSLTANSAGVAVTLGDAPDTGGLHLSSRELATINSTFAQVRIGSSDSGHFRIGSSLDFQNNVELIGGANMEITAGADKALTLKNVRGQDISLRANGNIALEASVQTSSKGNISVVADADRSGSGSITWGSAPTKAQKLQSVVTGSGDVTLSGAEVKLGTSVLPPKMKAPAWAFKSGSGDLRVETAAFTADSAAFESRGDITIDAAISAIANSKVKATNVLLEAIAQNSLNASSIKALAAVQLRADLTAGIVSLSGRTNINAVASILVESATFDRSDAVLKAGEIILPA
jgi:hypothetical protein